MTFSKSGHLDVVTRISGPHHHYLALQLQTDVDLSSIDIDVECCSPEGAIGPAEPSHSDEVRREVSGGIDAANQRLATRYRASRIQFGATDPPLRGVYRAMAERLVEHVCHARGHSAAAPMNQELLNPIEISN